jgi:transcriptional regulator with XRE-family HTH domain
MKPKLNTDLLASAIKTKRGKTGLRNTAIEIGGISPATLSRVELGNLPDVETFIKICNWLGVSTETFIAGSNESQAELSEKDKIVYQLRSSKELDSQTISAMVAMVDIAFTKVKKDGK